jgi:hypothetical protein
MMKCFIYLVCFSVLFACKTAKPKQTTRGDQRSQHIHQTSDSLYGGITPLGELITDKALMLSLLTELRANEGDLSHILENESYDMHYLVFPLRVVQVIQPNQVKFVSAPEILFGIDILNDALKDAWIQFKIVEVDTIYLPMTIQSLKDDDYQPYYALSSSYDLKNVCTLYLIDNENDLCKDFSCSRTNGFANILATSTNNVVLDKFFITDYKVLVHEFGHYFGLYHTAERNIFGIEAVDGSNCLNAGDRICDTPADPGELYSVYVNYSGCYMQGFKEIGTGLEYQPMINNYMSYYHPCFMRRFKFTKGQLEVILNAAFKVRHNQIIALAEFPLVNE